MIPLPVTIGASVLMPPTSSSVKIRTLLCEVYPHWKAVGLQGQCVLFTALQLEDQCTKISPQPCSNIIIQTDD